MIYKAKTYFALIYTGIVILCAGLSVKGQTKITARNKIKIMALARPYKDSVLLRWAPGNSLAWQTLNKYGYIIKRGVVYQNGRYNPRPVYKTITPKPVKPFPAEKWEALVMNDDKYALTAAQALYGEDFEITSSRAGASQFMNKLKENEQRYSIALFSADMSFELAKAMGLGFKDTTAKSNEVYNYIIFSAADKKILALDSAVVYAGFNKFIPLPKPKELTADAQGKGVMVSWPVKPYLGIYTYYQLERSLDLGKTFVKTKNLPVINPAMDDAQGDTSAFELDSVSALNRVIVYRVKGVSPFGEAGPPSDTVSVTAFHQLKNPPSITNTVKGKGTIKIVWKLPETKAEVLGYDIERSKEKEKGFVKINTKLLSAADTAYLDTKPSDINFYQIKVYGRGAVPLTSYSVLVQMPDSIPPAPPAELRGTINKQGIVKLTWKASPEADVYGYRVFRENAENGEYVQITKSTRLQNNYTDTIELKTLTKYIYYKIAVIDKRYNPSAFSAVLKLKRPDIVPPSPPVFTSVKSLANGIYLSWHNSSSEDVVRHELLRAEAGSEKWNVISSFTDTTQFYADESAVLKHLYQYKIRAVDDSQLLSESKALTAQRLDLGLQPDITTFKAVADRENQQIILKWEYNKSGVKNYILYKAEVSKPLRIYKILDAKQNTYTDSSLFINNMYQYRIRAVFADGTETRISKEIIVNY